MPDESSPAKHPGGRPREFDREAIVAALERYLDETPLPIVGEFCASQKMGTATLYEWPEAQALLERFRAKKEGALERMALKGSVNVAMAIFSLKNLGWSDRNETTHKGDKAHPLEFSVTDKEL